MAEFVSPRAIRSSTSRSGSVRSGNGTGEPVRCPAANRACTRAPTARA